MLLKSSKAVELSLFNCRVITSSHNFDAPPWTNREPSPPWWPLGLGDHSGAGPGQRDSFILEWLGGQKRCHTPFFKGGVIVLGRGRGRMKLGGNLPPCDFGFSRILFWEIFWRPVPERHFFVCTSPHSAHSSCPGAVLVPSGNQSRSAAKRIHKTVH
jgi:hypothetical protein